MEIEVRQRGGVLGMDRRYLVKDGQIEVTDRGEAPRSLSLDPEQAARIDELAQSASQAEVRGSDERVSDSMRTTVDIRQADESHSLTLRSGDSAPAEVWDLIGEVSRASAT